MSSVCGNLNNYDDPRKAHRVYQAYEPDLRELGLGGEIEAIVEDCRTADELDARFDLLITHARQRLQATHSTWVGEDVDANGWLSNARRALEDN